MIKKILLCMAIMTILEIVITIYLGSLLGTWGTISLSIVTGALGIYLVKHNGFGMMMGVGAQMLGGNLNIDLIAKLSLAIAGILLIIPGFVTDILGIVLLIPWCRNILVIPCTKLIMKKIMLGL
jgi:UPF0716 protein FxsA